MRLTTFGNGYEQRIRDGLFTNPRLLNLVFSPVNNTVGNQIAAFLAARGGAEAFWWTPPAPYGAKGAFVCDKFNFGFDSWGTKSISAIFREVRQVL